MPYLKVRIAVTPRVAEDFAGADPNLLVIEDTYVTAPIVDALYNKLMQLGTTSSVKLSMRK